MDTGTYRDIYLEYKNYNIFYTQPKLTIIFFLNLFSRIFLHHRIKIQTEDTKFKHWSTAMVHYREFSK